MRGTTLLGVSALLLAGCVPNIQSTTLIKASPRPAGQEIPLYSSKLPSCSYEEVGLVSAEVDGINGDAKVLRAMQERARRMGGDAVVGLGQQQTASATGLVGSTLITGTTKALSGTVIRFTDPDCRK